jgi:hypothetical protein
MISLALRGAALKSVILLMATCLSRGDGHLKAIVDVPKTSFNVDVRIPVLEREVVLHTDFSLTPYAITRDSEGGVVIAGSGGVRPGDGAWAKKIDGKGRVVWEYSTPALYPETHFLPAYYGVASMADGSTFLCGEMPKPPQSGEAAALLTHLDSRGQRLNEAIITPKVPPQSGLRAIRFQECTRWGNDVLVTGIVNTIISPAKDIDLSDRNYYRWFLLLDARGREKWESLVVLPHEPNPIFADANTALLQSGSDLFLSYTGSSLPLKTEVMRLDHTGSVSSQKVFDGAFRLVIPITPDDKIQLYGLSGETASLITLDQSLQEVHRVDKRVSEAVYPARVFRLRDQSLCIFGKGVYKTGQIYQPAIAHVDPDLTSLKALRPIDSNGPYRAINILAAAPLGAMGHFVTAVRLMPHSHPVRGSDGNKESLGIAVEFVKFE